MALPRMRRNMDNREPRRISGTLAFQRPIREHTVWAIAFFTVALTAASATVFLMPATTVFVIAAVGIAAIVFWMPGPILWLRTSRARVRVAPSRHRDHAGAAITLAAGTGAPTLDETSRSTADDALDLARLDDDGGRQMARPPS